MVCFHTSIPVDQHIDMAKPVNSTDPGSKVKQINQSFKNRRLPNLPNQLNIPACEQSRSAVIDVIILFAVICACGCLLYPYASFLAYKSLQLGGEMMSIVGQEILRNPMVFGCLGLSFLFTTMALVAVTIYTDSKCGRSACRGLRKAAEFDIQLEMGDCVKKSTFLAKNAFKNGLFELARDRQRELESELKKMAPPNGRAILVFRASCGCSIGRMEVQGPRKTRKVKK